MKAIKKIRNGIQKCDFFNTTQFLRYHGQPQHQTFMGGAFSMVLIITLMVAFSNKVLSTLNMLSINSSTSNQNADDPTPLTLSTYGVDQVNFMFGVEIWHHNLNAGERYFDINLVNQNYNYGSTTNMSKPYLLQPCTLDHWKGYPAIQKKFQDLNMNYWLCLPKGIDYQIGGKYSSPVQNTIEVSVNQCTNSSIDPRPCVSNELIDQYFKNSSQKIYFTIYFTNPLINPDIADFLTYYLEDSNYIIFSQTGGEEAQIMMEDYTITTDNSISPLTDYSEITGGIVGQNAIKNRYEVSPDDTNYCTFFIFKSPNSRNIDRSYVKLDEILSYIGGLFGTLTMLLFVVKVYNNYAFEINLGAVLYKKDGQEVNLNKYNFLYFIAHVIYRVLKEKLACCNWGNVKGYHKCREEVLKQIDVLYLLKRVTFLERATEILLESHQLKGVHLLKHFSIDQAKKNRRNFKLHEKAISQCERLEYQRKNSHTTAGRMKPAQNCLQGNKVDNDDSINMHDQSPNKKSDTKLGKELATVSQNSNDKHEEQHQESQSSSSEEEEVAENEENTLTLLLQLKKEKDVSPVSKRIYDNLNQTLKDFIDKYQANQSQNGSANEDTYINNNIKIIDFRPRKRFRSLPKVEESHFNRLINRQPLALDNSENAIQANGHFFEDISIQ